MTTASITIDRAIVWRRLHSLTGFWFVLFLLEHLFTNSQAALFFGEDGFGFVRAVNWLHNLPYLPVIEIILLGVPILYHIVLGVRYLFTAKSNVIGHHGKRPKMQYARNWAYTFQRWTSWILLVGLLLHIWYMRFYMYPTTVRAGSQTVYLSKYRIDEGLYSVADRLQVKLYDSDAIEREKIHFAKQTYKMDLVEQKLRSIEEEGLHTEPRYNAEVDSIYQSWQNFQRKQSILRGLEGEHISPGEVVAMSTNFGNILLLTVRDAFKSVTKAVLYTLFVAAACFHAFNGLWTFLITWGILLNMRSRSRMMHICVALMLILGFLGMMSIWGTYWINLRT